MKGGKEERENVSNRVEWYSGPACAYTRGRHRERAKGQTLAAGYYSCFLAWRLGTARSMVCRAMSTRPLAVGKKSCPIRRFRGPCVGHSHSKNLKRAEYLRLDKAKLC